MQGEYRWIYNVNYGMRILADWYGCDKLKRMSPYFI